MVWLKLAGQISAAGHTRKRLNRPEMAIPMTCDESVKSSWNLQPMLRLYRGLASNASKASVLYA